MLMRYKTICIWKHGENNLHPSSCPRAQLIDNWCASLFHEFNEQGRLRTEPGMAIGFNHIGLQWIKVKKRYFFRWKIDSNWTKNIPLSRPWPLRKAGKGWQEAEAGEMFTQLLVPYPHSLQQKWGQGTQKWSGSLTSMLRGALHSKQKHSTCFWTSPFMKPLTWQSQCHPQPKTLDPPVAPAHHINVKIHSLKGACHGLKEEEETEPRAPFLGAHNATISHANPSSSSSLAIKAMR